MPFKINKLELEGDSAPQKEEVYSLHCSKALYSFLRAKVTNHNDTYPKARVNIEQLRSLITSHIAKGLCYSVAYINAFLNSKASTGYSFKEAIISDEDLSRAKEELVKANLDKVTAGDLYFEDDFPAWKSLI